MSRYRHLSAELDAIKLAAKRRVEAVCACVGVLCPDQTPQARIALAEKVLDLCRGEAQNPPQIKITPAQVQEIVWRNMQCISPHCPMLLFSDQIAAELNEFFNEEE